jgi:orotate phosphoribosyltransferase-like protein
MRTRRSLEEIQELVKKAQDLMAQGYNKPDAARELGVGKSTLYPLLKRYGNKPHVVEYKAPKRLFKGLTARRATTPSKVMLFVGDSSSVMEIAREFGGVQ